MIPGWVRHCGVGRLAVDEVGSASDVVEARRRVQALDRLIDQLDGQIVVLDAWEGDPSTLHEALASIVQAMQRLVRGVHPAWLITLLAQIDGERLHTIDVLDRAGQLF
jgi:Tfp pilus assembly protein PilN